LILNLGVGALLVILRANLNETLKSFLSGNKLVQKTDSVCFKTYIIAFSNKGEKCTSLIKNIRDRKMARKKGLINGDKNSCYLHQAMKVRKARRKNS